MTRYRRPASAVRRIRNRLLPGAGAAVALIVAWAMTTSGTLSLWQDRHVQLRDVTVSAGMPGLSVSGFEGLDHDYEADALQAQTTVVVTNTGNVALHDFDATRALIGGSSALAAAIDTSFVPTGGGASTDWDGWLAGLTLAPGESVSYLATTALDTPEVVALAEQDAEFEVAVAATAGANWTVVGENGFAQAVLKPPAADLDDFNSNVVIHSSHSLEFKWGFVGSANGTQFNVTMRRPAEQTSYSLGTAADWYPAMSISSSSIPPALVPAQGTTSVVVVEVYRASDSELVARGTLWLTGIGGGQATLSTTPPAAPKSAAAPMSAPVAPQRAAAASAPLGPAVPPAAAPAALAPETPAPAPTAVPAEPAPAPAQTAPETPPTHDSEPVAAPAPVIEVGSDAQDSTALVVSWLNPSGEHAAAEFRVEFNGMPIGDGPAGEPLTLRIPEDAWDTEGELIVTVVTGDEVLDTTTTWVSVGTDGTISFRAEASASSIEDAE